MTKKNKEEQEELIPKIEEKNTDLTPDKFFNNLDEENDIKDKEEIKNKSYDNLQSIEDIDDIIETNNTDGTPDSFFKNVIDKLFNDENVSLKTEYENEDSVFCGAKLDFLTSECGFKFGTKFLPLREKKMISHKRQSRREIVATMWEKKEEIRAQEEQELYKNKINM